MNELGRDHGTLVLCGTGLIGGALLGAAVNGEKGAIAGAALGTAAGCYAGSVWQSRMKELDRIAKEEGLKLTMQPLEVASTAPGVKPIEAGLVAAVEEDGAMFQTNSDQLTGSGLRVIGKIADTYAKSLNGAQGSDMKRRLLVVGHTDATGPADFNQALSERRAKTVGKLMQGAGIPASMIYYQGAGASRPVADNSDPLLRGKNRRVEIVETTSEEMLVKRIDSEENSTKYLKYGTATQVKALSKPTAAPRAETRSLGKTSPAVDTPKVVASTSKASPAVAASSALVDFGGAPAIQASPHYAIKPKADGFTLISTAQANEIPMRSCDADMPRQTGQVLSLADGKPLKPHAVREYLPGYNNVVWANTVNGHLVTISPVSILRDGAQVDRQPFIQIVENYGTPKKEELGKLNAVANTYEGADEVLYRVFTTGESAPVSCLDVVFSKGNAKANQGSLFYPEHSGSYIAQFVPIRTQ
jgi:outer membrane protein OmpA-like peptidoglycan-associated protein